jgi:hypothetical protein
MKVVDLEEICICRRNALWLTTQVGRKGDEAHRILVGGKLFKNADLEKNKEKSGRKAVGLKNISLTITGGYGPG